VFVRGCRVRQANEDQVGSQGGEVLSYAPKAKGGWRAIKVNPIVVVLLGFVGLALTAIICDICRPRVTYYWQMSASQLRGIGYALQVYHHDFADDPPDLQTLVHLDYYVAGGCSPHYRRRGKDGSGYCFVSGQRDSDPNNWIVAFDDPHVPNTDRLNILYRDWRVRSLRRSDFEAEIRRFIQDYEKQVGRPPTIIGPDVPLSSAADNDTTAPPASQPATRPAITP
jgi:hypothetical protein